MKFRLDSLIRHGLWAVPYSAVGAIMVLVIVFVVYLNSRADLHIWHLAELDEEFRAPGSRPSQDYLALEERLFLPYRFLHSRLIPANY